jgi:hypothetical protein
MNDNKTIVLSELSVPGAIPLSSQSSELNTNDNRRHLLTEYLEIKELVRSNTDQQLDMLQGIEIEIVVFDASDPTRSSIQSFNDSLATIPSPLAGLNPDPETWPQALELNSVIPAPVLHVEEWFVSLAHGLMYLRNDGFTVALASAQSTTSPEHLTIDYLHKKRRTQELSAAMPQEVVDQPPEAYSSKHGTIVQIAPSTISITAGNQQTRLTTGEQRVLSTDTKAPLGSLQFHLSGDPRKEPGSKSSCHGVCHNSALIATLFGLAIGTSAPIFAGVNTLIKDFRLPLYRATIGARRAPLGESWFDDEDILKIYDNVMTSDKPLLISLDSSKRTTGTSFARSALKTVWPPLIRPTVTKDVGGLNVHPEIRPIGTPHTLHDAVSLCYFLAGIWKRIPDYLEEQFGIDCSTQSSLEDGYPYEKFLDSIWDVTIAGLDGTVFWFDGSFHDVRGLLMETILPLADQGLVELGIPNATRSLYLGGIQRNLELKVTSSSIELIPIKQGVTNPSKIRSILKRIHVAVTEQSLDSFIDHRYTEPFFIADAYMEKEFREYLNSLCF